MKAAILSVIKEAVRLISELKTLCVMYYFSSEAMVGHKQINPGVTCLQTLGLEFRASPFKFSHISSVFGPVSSRIVKFIARQMDGL